MFSRGGNKFSHPSFTRRPSIPVYFIIPVIPLNPNFEHFDDGQLKALLDEAITYKTPKDREHKSEAFKILLQRAEIQEQAQEMNYEFKASRTSGGSLQDLANPADVDFFGSSMNHQRKHHNSRQKKYSTTSVSTRQREGGSLPSNVNVATNHLFQYEPTQPFLNEVKKQRTSGRKVDIHPIVMYSSVASDLVDKRERKIHETDGGVVLVSREGKVKVADEVQHLEHDSVQNHGDSLSGDDYEKNSLNKIPRASFTSQKNINLGQATQVDEGVEFALGDEKNVDMTPLQLNSAYNSVNSVVGAPAENPPPQPQPQPQAQAQAQPQPQPQKNVQATLTHKIPPKQAAREQKTDENGNSVNTFNATATVTVPQTAKTKKKNISKSERNTITKRADEIDGFRGRDNIDTLVRFIENKEKTKKLKAKNGNSVIVAPKKEKKGAGKKESGNNKLKKSNSMDELSSCSKLEDIARSENASNHENGGVTLRSKAKKAASETTPLLGQKGGKRGERRSWGTEELSYLGESEGVLEQPKKVKKESPIGLPGSLKQKKDDQQSLSVESMSATYEMAEFHVVTKKKKPKKRQNIIVTPFEGETKVTPKVPARQDHSVGQNRAKVVYNHQTSSQFTNDRDVYVSDRRKSTSSVPPSEKSDSSDLDSVHSLPVESSTALSLLTPTTSSTPPQASYADIARIANSGGERFQLKDNWPAMPRHTSETMETASTNSGSTTASYKSQNSVVQRSVPSNGVPSHTSLSDGDDICPPENAKKCPVVAPMNGVIQPVTNMADVIKAAATESTKSQLQKSKSVENDSSTYFGSIDHYPALEKTVKSKVHASVKNVPNVDMMTKKSKSIVSSNNSSVSVNSSNISSSSSNCNASVSPNLAVKMSLVEQLKSPALVSSVNRSEMTPRSVDGVDDAPPKPREKVKRCDVVKSEPSRPAVIILNDNDRYQLNEGITFGFDINNQLLFGDFNENELHLLDNSPAAISCCDTGYGSNETTDTSVSSHKSNEMVTEHLNHTAEEFAGGVPEEEDKCDPMPILKACVSVQTSMEHLYISDTPTVRVEERDSSIIASIPAQISFTHSDTENQIIQMLSPTMRMCGKKLNVRYVAPAGEELILTTYNHDKIVNFVGLAWEDVAGNDGVKYYDGQ